MTTESLRLAISFGLLFSSNLMSSAVFATILEHTWTVQSQFVGADLLPKASDLRKAVNCTFWNTKTAGIPESYQRGKSPRPFKLDFMGENEPFVLNGTWGGRRVVFETKSNGEFFGQFTHGDSTGRFVLRVNRAAQLFGEVSFDLDYGASESETRSQVFPQSWAFYYLSCD